MAVYYKCPACKGEHRSMIQTGSKAAFETGQFKDNSEQCPVTRKLITLSKPHLFWKDEGDRK